MKLAATNSLAFLILGFCLGKYLTPSLSDSTKLQAHQGLQAASDVQQNQKTGSAKFHEPEHRQMLSRWNANLENGDALTAKRREGALADLLGSGIDIQGMLAMADSLPTDQRESFLRDATRVWLEKDAVECCRFVESIPDTGYRLAATEELANTWGKKDPSLAAAWAWQQKSVCAIAPSLVINSWASQDAPGASLWLNTLPASPARDQAAVSLIEPLLQQDPQSARSWIDSLADANTKAAYQQRLAELGE